MPNIPLAVSRQHGRALGMDLDPGIETYAATGILNAGNGVADPFGRELSLSQALMNAVGVKVGAYRRTRRYSRSRWSPMHRSARS